LHLFRKARGHASQFWRSASEMIFATPLGTGMALVTDMQEKTGRHDSRREEATN
jgi:hypothetical protein